MDPQTVDQNYAQLQQQGQQTAALIQALAGKLQAAAAAGDMNAREWMLDLKEVALGVQQEEGQVSLLLQSIHSMVNNHVQSAGQPGYQGPESWQSQPPPRRRSWDSLSDASTFEDAIGEAVLGAATKAIGRVIGRKMRQAYNERVAPAMAARQESVLNERVAIAQRHPDLRACLRDQVIFLAGGTRVLPLAGAMRVRTVEQSDALVAQLRG